MRFCIIFAIICALLGCGGSGSKDREPTQKDDRKILNPIIENTIPFGLSTFAMGVPAFPLEDAQTPEGLGYKSVAKVVRHIATNELYTFAEKPNYQQVKDTIKHLIDSGHEVTHQIYVLSGPGMRRCSDWWINGVAGRKVCDEEFVNMVRWNPTVREALRKLFVEVVKHAGEIEALGATVLICLELEDNHSKDSFKALLDVFITTGWPKSQIVRNGGSIGDFGLRYETHTSDINVISYLRPGDVYNNDGNTFCLDSDQGTKHCAPGALTENHMRYVLGKAQEKGVMMFFWHDVFQGLIQVEPGNFPYPPLPRTYVFRKPAEQAALLLGIEPGEVLLAE